MEEQIENLIEEPKPKAEKPKKEKKKKTSRTTETMFRSLMSNHIQLSTLADRKASLMISVNTIVLSVMSSLMFKDILSHKILFWPMLVLVVVCLTTIIFSILATNPILKTKKNDDKPLDILFFGEYTKLSVEEYQEEMKNLILKDEELHNSLTANIYAQGVNLRRKYRLLKIAYTIFMVGFPLAIVLFMGVYVTNP